MGVVGGIIRGVDGGLMYRTLNITANCKADQMK